MHDVYLNIFKRIGINIIPVVSDGGTMGGRVSEEYQTFTTLGEDIILYDNKNNIGLNKEVLEFEDRETFIKAFGVSDINNLKEYHALELGNNFELGTKYSDSMKLYYIDEQGDNKSYYMGCYGIGIGRIIACMLENSLIKENNKIKGFAIPYNVAPYKVQIIYTNNNKEIAEKLYEYLLQNNVSAIIDDREDLTIGNRIMDTYVMGTPKMIVVGNHFNGVNYEIEDIKTNEKVHVQFEDVLSVLKN